MDNVFRGLGSVFNDWTGFLANPQYIIKDYEITWPNYSRPILKYPVLISHITEMADGGQYTFQVVEDGSLFQIMYRYQNRGRKLVAASLAYYSTTSDRNSITNPSKADKIDDISAFPDEEDENIVLPFEDKFEGRLDSPVAWLRIDYSPGQSKGVLHHACHMHISLFPDARIPVNNVPNPHQFVEFVISLCYPQVYKKQRLNQDGLFLDENKIRSLNSRIASLPENQACKHMLHLKLPFRAE